MANQRMTFLYVILAITALFLTIGLSVQKNQKPVPDRPAPRRTIPRQYDYYRIIDEKTEKTLMTVSSSPVTEGDELITGENKRYRVVKVEGNVAYARYVETVHLNE